jgi:hypothetical protein
LFASTALTIREDLYNKLISRPSLHGADFVDTKGEIKTQLNLNLQLRRAIANLFLAPDIKKFDSSTLDIHMNSENRVVPFNLSSWFNTTTSTKLKSLALASVDPGDIHLIAANLPLLEDLAIGTLANKFSVHGNSVTKNLCYMTNYMELLDLGALAKMEKLINFSYRWTLEKERSIRVEFIVKLQKELTAFFLLNMPYLRTFAYLDGLNRYFKHNFEVFEQVIFKCYIL